MRTSKRTVILDAIVELIEQGGIKAITYDAICEKTQITRGGLLYHFPTRDDLIFGIHQHMSAQWDEVLQKALGAELATATPEDRVRAYLKCTKAVSRAELILLVESTMDEAVDKLWQDVIDKWAPLYPDPNDDHALSLFIVRLAADGLWVNDALTNTPMPSDVRLKLHEKLEAMIDDFSQKS